jgi:hypothetical protein
MAVMAVVPFVPVLADLFQSMPVFAIPGFVGVSIVPVILILLAAIPIYFIVASFPLWLSAKIAVSGNTTYGTALKVLICQFLATLVVSIVVRLIAMMAGLAGGGNRFSGLDAILLIVSIVLAILITANSYSIGVVHALGVQVLSFVLAFVMLIVVSLGIVAVVGVAGAQGHLRESLDKLNQARNSVSLPSSSAESSTLPPFSQPASGSPSQPDYSAEIDGLLNAALHPSGTKPQLTEREDIVRTLQQRLQAQRGNISAGDARAINVYQNQLNRYLLLLNQVKAERKAHPAGEPTSASPQAAR